MRTRSLSRVTTFFGVATFVAASVILSANIGSATTANGVISGTVTECAPGPIIYAPGKPAPRPRAMTITLRHDGTAFASQHVKFPTMRGWTGTFVFRVPAGLYEVLTSSRAYSAKWVNLGAATHRTVKFGFVACPL